MRSLMLIIMVFACAADMAAQEETLFKGGAETTGFGGPVVKYTSVHNQRALMVGGRGGWVINHSFVIGGGGYVAVTEVDAPEGVLPLQGPLDIKFGYGGLEVEYIVDSKSLGHFSIYALAGCGDVHYAKDVGPLSESTETTGESDFVFVLEPAINAELNVTTWLRLNAGVSYRFVNGVTQVGLKNSDFSGMAATVTFKFGDF